MKKIFTSLSYGIVFSVLFFTGCAQTNPLAEVSDKIEYRANCTPIPFLYENWRRAVIEKDMGKNIDAVKDNEFMKYIKIQRKIRVENLNTRFLDIARMTPTLREKANERVLWENEKIMALVDTYSQAPKVLVVAKLEGVWLINDADEQLRQDMAIVAVAASDAMIEEGKRNCNSENYSEIEIHTLNQLAIQQLHIHVDPKWELSSSENDYTFYDGVEKRLIEKLGKG